MTFPREKRREEKKEGKNKKGNSIEIRAVKDHARRLYETNEVSRGWLDFPRYLDRSVQSESDRKETEFVCNARRPRRLYLSRGILGMPERCTTRY